MNIIDGVLIILIVFWFGFIGGGGIYHETQINKDVKQIAGEDYIKFHGKSVTGHDNINEIYNRDGNCVGIFWIENNIINHKFREIKNFESCKGLLIK